MLFASIMGVINLIVFILIVGIFIWVISLIIRALLKYLNSSTMTPEKLQTTKSLAEALKTNRTNRNMTQEFVAEAIGVSRQSISKWESGKSEPTASNLVSLAKLFGISVDDLLK